jgi:hypothetical protein
MADMLTRHLPSLNICIMNAVTQSTQESETGFSDFHIVCKLQFSRINVNYKERMHIKSRPYVCACIHTCVYVHCFITAASVEPN